MIQVWNSQLTKAKWWKMEWWRHLHYITHMAALRITRN